MVSKIKMMGMPLNFNYAQSRKANKNTWQKTLLIS